MLTREVGVKVHLFEHGHHHATPEACFPNNWFSTTVLNPPAPQALQASLDRALVTYPMKCPNRQLERRSDIIDYLLQMESGDDSKRKRYEHFVQLEKGNEDQGKFLEGTGCIVADRTNKKAYVALSERSNLAVAEEWSSALGYDELVTFRSEDAECNPVYHTNVIMAVGTSVAVVCGDSIADGAERRKVLGSLGHTHEVIDITKAQMESFCGNVLEVVDGRGLPAMVMSTRAYDAFTEDQKRVMRRHLSGLHHTPISTLERVSGGGVRCAIAEIF